MTKTLVFQSTGGGSGSGGKGSYKYLVRKESSTYNTYDADGAKVAGSGTSSLATALNDEAFNGLYASRTVPETVVIQGDGAAALDIDDTISFPSLVDIVVNAKLKAVNSLNKDVFSNADQATNNYGVRLRGFGIIDGNKSNQSAGKLFEFINATSPPVTPLSDQQYPTALYLEDLTFQDPYDYGIYINFTSASAPGSTMKWRNIHVVGYNQASSHELIYLQAIYDSQIQDCFIDSDSKALYILSCSSLDMDFDYFNGCAVFENSIQGNICSRFWDADDNAHSLELKYCRHMNIHDTFFRAIGNGTANTYDAIKLTRYDASAGSINNRFSNIYAGRSYLGAGTKTFKYAVEEDYNTHDYNIMSCIDGSDCATGAVRRLGSNSKADSDDILGSIVTS